MNDDIWDAHTAQANLPALLAEARAGLPQTIRDGGENDLRVALADPGPGGPGSFPQDYVLGATAAAEALVIALAQWHEKHYPSKGEQPSEARRHMPANLAGDVAHWIKRERGVHALALHVADYAIALRNAQDTLGLPRSRVSAIAAGLDLTARPTLIDSSASQAIAERVWADEWGEDAAETVLGDDWGHIARRGDGPRPVF
ncbi:hypothetical protein C8K30_1011089 [Promicromonospora sp. AC04]|uniref:hypothetical protein n=1 Tax=Promicromonospora sp. AC04 TaxID=2135723 RepID=UPI000D35990D|nr:hypothetical protein [Promicromonospora sp. AC04]PUB32563.1 hypothetical protein C8K30_1011089 [Promicromonospora sp. AC04]